MRHPHTSRITALGAAMLLMLASCGSPDEDQDGAPAEDSAMTESPEATQDAQETQEPDQSQEPAEPDASDEAEEPEESTELEESSEAEDPAETEQPEDSETSPSPEDQDDAATADFSTETQETEGFPEGFTVGDEPNRLVDIRSGVHEGFDRIVFEFSGDGLPSWRGEYTDSAAELGRGEPIEIAGERILELNVNGPSWGTESPDDLLSGEYYERDRGRVFEEVFIQGPFENNSQYLIGVQEERPFKVQLLEEPVRIVVDLATDQ